MTFLNRDRFTWLAYLMLGYYSYQQATLSPAEPFIRAELGLNYSVSALHFTAMSFGMVLAGLFTDRAAARWGRKAVFWGGGGGMALAGLLLIVGRQVSVTIPAALLMGAIGTALMAMCYATVADRFGEHRATGLTEANTVASVGAMLAPLAVGGLAQVGLGWRGSLIAGGLVWVLMLLVFWTAKFPAAPAGSKPAAVTPRRSLPAAFWAYWLVVVLGVAVEWGIIYWSAAFLERVVGLPKVTASTLVSAFFLAMVIGRFTGSRLTRFFPPNRLLIGAVAIVLVGFPIFWLAQTPVLNIAGLFIAGLGVANMYPMTLSSASNAAPEHTTLVSARVSLAAGVAMLTGPQLLGAAADRIGIQGAYGIIAALMVGVIVVVFIANHLAAQRRPVPLTSAEEFSGTAEPV